MMAMKQVAEDSLGVVEPKVFKELVATGVVHGAAIRASESGKGLLVILDVGEQQRALGQYRGGPRYFQSFDGAVSLLQQNGITQFSGDSAGWIPKTQPKGTRTKRRQVEAAVSL